MRFFIPFALILSVFVFIYLVTAGKEYGEYSEYIETINCRSVMNCPLESGDILIRRHITDNTKIIDFLTNQYFTHVGMFVDDKIFESTGKNINPDDEIVFRPISKTDWQKEFETLIVLRPVQAVNVESLQKEFERISKDQSYQYGLSWQGEHHFICSDLLYQTLIDNVIIKRHIHKGVVTPDVLFKTLTEQDSFIPVRSK